MTTINVDIDTNMIVTHDVYTGMEMSLTISMTNRRNIYRFRYEVFDNRTTIIKGNLSIRIWRDHDWCVPYFEN